MARASLALALCALASAADPYTVEFTVQLGELLCEPLRSVPIDQEISSLSAVTESGKDTFELTVHPDWAPLGAARFRELVDVNFFDSVRFFRTISGFSESR